MEVEAVLTSISSSFLKQDFLSQVTVSLDCMGVIFLFRLYKLVLVRSLMDVVPESNWPSVLVSTVDLPSEASLSP
jgi:hypothetical protein